MPAYNLEQLRRDAKLLRKSLRSSNPTTRASAISRVSVLRRFEGLSEAQITAALKRYPFKFKDALLVVALESGYASWAHLKQAASGEEAEPEFKRPAEIPPSGAASPWAGSEFNGAMLRGWGLGATSLSFSEPLPDQWETIEGWVVQGIDRIPRAWARLSRRTGKLRVDWFDDRGHDLFDRDAVEYVWSAALVPPSTPDWAVLLAHLCSRSAAYHAPLQAALLAYMEQEPDGAENLRQWMATAASGADTEEPTPAWAGEEPAVSLSYAEAAQISCSLMDYRNEHLHREDPTWEHVVRLERIFYMLQERINRLLGDPADLHQQFELTPSKSSRRKPVTLSVGDCRLVGDAIATWRLRPSVFAIEQDEVDDLARRWLAFTRAVAAAGDSEFDLPLAPRRERSVG